jgi:hypothetical protein
MLARFLRWFMRSVSLALFVVLCLSSLSFAQPKKTEPTTKPSKDVFKQAKLDPKDPEQLIKFLNDRILNPDEIVRINRLLEKLSSESFEERLQASEEVAKLPPGAIPLIRKAAFIDSTQLNTTDFEKAYRAELALKKIELIPEAVICRAVVKALAPLEHPNKTETLIRYLNLAEGSVMVEEIQRTLMTAAVEDGKPNAKILELLNSPVPAYRILAGSILIEGGPTTARIRIPEGHRQVWEMLKSEKDAEVRYQLLFTLATTSRDADAISKLLDLIPEMPRGYLWRMQDMLNNLAGVEAPKTPLSADKIGIEAYAKDWKTWWSSAKTKIDFEKWAYIPRIRGNLMLVTQDTRSNVTSVQELNPDFSKKWQINNLMYISDVLPLPDGNIMLSDVQGRIQIRSTLGAQISAHTVKGNAKRAISGQPHQLTSLPDGKVVIACRNCICVANADDPSEQEVIIERQSYDITSAARLPNGEYALMLQNNNNGQNSEHLVFYDKSGKEIADKKIKTNPPYYLSYMVALSDERLIVTEQQKIVEYDIKTKKEVWSYDMPMCTSVQRLPNGNTLIVENANYGSGVNRILEIDPNKKEVWKYALPQGQRIARAYLR